MNILTSILAFAGLMIVFSTLVSGIVESLIGFFRLRSSNLRFMLKSFLEQELKQTDPDSIVKSLVKNPVVGSRLSGLANSSNIDWLSTKAFFQRLAKTEIGKNLVEEMKQEAEGKGEEIFEKHLKNRIQYLENTYDRYAAASSETLRKNSYVLTFVTSIAFALLFNINVETVFVKLVNSPDARQEIIASIEGNEKLNDDLKTLNQNLAEEVEKLSQGNLSDQEAKDLVKELKDEMVRTGDVIGALSDAGLPIGWEYYPYGKIGTPETTDATTETLHFLRWFVFTLIAGFLISLGGPFWYRVFNNLSGLVGALRAFSGKNPELVDEKTKDTETASQSGEERTEELAKTFMLVFEESKKYEKTPS